MSLQFLFGLAFAIPLGIAANLLTPRIKGLLDKTTQAGQQRRAKQAAKENQLISTLTKDSAAYHSYILQAVINIIFVISIALVLGGMIVLLRYVAEILGMDAQLPEWWDAVYTVGLYVDILVSSIVIFDYCKETRDVIERVKESSAINKERPTAPE